MGNFINEEDPEDIYGSIEYNGKTYIMCGIIDKSFDKKYIDKCIGYIFILLWRAD